MNRRLRRRIFFKEIGCACAVNLLIPRMGWAQDSKEFLCSTVIKPTSDLQLQSVGETENTLITDENDDRLTLQGTVRKRSVWKLSDGLSPNSGHIRLGIGFIGNESANWKDQVIKRAMHWLPSDRPLSRKIYFDFNVPLERCQIRIAQTGINGIPKRNNSAVGRDALLGQFNGMQTMNIFNLSSVEHEFGHALGLVHEHTNPEVPVTINKAKAIDFYYRENGWSAETTEQNLLTQGERCIGDTNFNPTSVMAYPIPAEITNEGVGLFPSDNITERDRRCLDALYG